MRLLMGLQHNFQFHELTKGFHPVELRFFENRGVARLRLYWQRATDVERQIVPRGFLVPPEDVSDRPTPRVTAIEPAVGDAVMAAKANVTDQDTRDTWILFGDPSMQLKQ